MVLQPLEGERIDELRNWLLFFFVAEGQRQDLRHWVLLLLLSFVAEAREKGFDALGDVCVLLRKERKRQDLTHWVCVNVCRTNSEKEKKNQNTL